MSEDPPQGETPPSSVAPPPTETPSSTEAAPSTETVPPTEAAPPTEAPAPEPPQAEPETDPAGLAGDVERVVRTWAAAWSAQQPDDYIACYAPSFSPPGLSRQQWEAQRRARIRAPASIAVKTLDLAVEVLDSKRARAVFRQNYETDTKRLFTWKTMELERLPEGWRIVSERTGR